MFIAAAVVGCQSVASAITLSLHICTDTGLDLGTSIELTPAASAQQINNQIEAAAKAALGAAFGISIVPQDTVRIFGAVSN